MMTLKYQISRSTHLEPAVLRKRINDQLEKARYNVIERNNQLITFDLNNGEFNSRSQLLRMADYGEIAFATLDGQATVNYHYLISYKIEVIYLAIGLLICFVVADIWAILIYIPFLIQLILRINIVKKEGEVMMDYMTWNGKLDVDV